MASVEGGAPQIGVGLMEASIRHFRDVLGHFSTGVVVVTADGQGGRAGMTCQSVVSLSLDPPLVLFCPAKTSTSWPRMREAGHFCINILAADQEALASRFARSGGDKFVGVDWTPGVTGAPVLAGTLAHVECTLQAVYDGGDHDIAVGAVVDLAIRRDTKPLVFFRGSFLELA
jgi:3-hydroxy-9,10-secoandrosta-1,3,5(10)-triene-9,17-dione monooxygenase reductase component